MRNRGKAIVGDYRGRTSGFGQIISTGVVAVRRRTDQHVTNMTVPV
jgi:hypothetical protein